jgi:hypothetical protein
MLYMKLIQYLLDSLQAIVEQFYLQLASLVQSLLKGKEVK